jgi:hypothetical protein
MRKVVIIDGTMPEDKCEYCGKVDDLRPYGKNGARICFSCAMKPENKTTTEATFRGILNGESERPTNEQKN